MIRAKPPSREGLGEKFLELSVLPEVFRYKG